MNVFNGIPDFSSLRRMDSNAFRKLDIKVEYTAEGGNVFYSLPVNIGGRSGIAQIEGDGASVKVDGKELSESQIQGLINSLAAYPATRELLSVRNALILATNE